MKKLVFLMIAMFCLVACNGNKTEKYVDSDSTYLDSTACGLTPELEDSIDSVNGLTY